jgi:hypothetical protein
MQAWMRWALLGGVVLLVGVVAWRLTAGSYKGDIQKICNAETNAGGQRGAVENLAIGMKWAKEHLDTPEASTWFTELEKKGMGDRVVVLRAETQRLGIASCPLADTFSAVQADADYRTDLYTLCGGSAIDLPKVEGANDADRLSQIRGWIAEKAKSPRTKVLGDKLAETPPQERSRLVRQTANDFAVYQCALVDTLEKPQAKERKDEAVIKIGNPEINGTLSTELFVAAVLANMEPLRKCYEAGLAKNADLAGRVLIKLRISPKGKVDNTSVVSSNISDPAVAPCLAKAIESVKFPEPKSLLVTVLAPFDLIPKLKLPEQPLDPHGH